MVPQSARPYFDPDVSAAMICFRLIRILCLTSGHAIFLPHCKRIKTGGVKWISKMTSGKKLGAKDSSHQDYR